MTARPEYYNFALLSAADAVDSDANEPSTHRPEDRSTLYATADCTFVSTPPAELICPICHLLLRDPYQTQCCGSHYCGYCLQQELSVGKQCVFCQTRQVTAFRDINVTRRVNALKVKCRHDSLGCEWLGDLADLGEHLGQCPRKRFPCRMCGECFSKESIGEHVTDLCLKRKFQCLYCKDYNSSYEQVRDSHWPKCLFYPIYCPNGCSKGYIPRREMLKHLRDECNTKDKLREMTVTLEKLQSQLKERDAKIEELQKEVDKSDPSCHHDGIKSECQSLENDNAQLVERITEIQKGRAEVEHENICLLKDVEVRDRTIEELKIQNNNLKKNLNQLEQDLSSQLQAMNALCDNLRDEKDTLEQKLSGLPGTEKTFDAVL